MYMTVINEALSAVTDLTVTVNFTTLSQNNVVRSIKMKLLPSLKRKWRSLTPLSDEVRTNCNKSVTRTELVMEDTYLAGPICVLQFR